MEKENASKADVLADLFGPNLTMESPSPRKRRYGSRIEQNSPKNAKTGDCHLEANSPPKRMPLSPNKFNIQDDRSNEIDSTIKKTISRNLFGGRRNENETNLSIVTPKKVRQKTDEILGKIKAALSLENPGEILGREKEAKEIKDFVTDAIKDEMGCSLYISGQPGTGKSATINNIIDQINFKKLKTQKVFINCMSVENSSTIYSNLLEKFAPEITVPKTVRWQKSKFSQFITSDDSPMNVLILDEMDQLSSRNEKILYDLFELAASSNSRMILIGIANGLDLLERVLPNLPKSCKPNQMNFQPYTFQQISTLIKARLTPEMNTKLEPMAIMMCAKKIAAMAGDARKALDVLRRATEIAGRDKSEKVKISHVNEVLNQTYTDRSGAELPFHQQLAIISFIKLAKEDKLQCSMAEVLKKYKSIAAARKLPTVAEPDFKEGIDLLIQSAMISKIVKPRKIAKYELAMNEDDAATKLGQKSKAILSILE